MSGAKRARPELQRLLDNLRKDDIVFIWRLDRLARSTKDLLEIIETIEKAGAQFKSIAEPWADTTSPTGKLLITFFAGLGEFERELIRERTNTGRIHAKSRGVKFGRPQRLSSEQKELAYRLLEEGPSGCHHIRCSCCHNLSTSAVIQEGNQMLNWFKKKGELDKAVQNRITALSQEGDALSEKNDYQTAIQTYWKAWDLLPEPRTEWEAATWILAAIGDANFISGDFVAGRDNLSMAMTCPNALGNPFLHLRLGQCQFELGDFDKAADELIRALMGDGKEIFSEGDSKYFEFLTTRADAPAGGW